MHEKRERLRIERRVTLHLEHLGERHLVRSRNLSLGGVFVETALRLRHGARLRICMSLPTHPDPIVAEAWVRWSEPDGVGVRFGGLRARELWALARFLGSSEPRVASV